MNISLFKKRLANICEKRSIPIEYIDGVICIGKELYISIDGDIFTVYDDLVSNFSANISHVKFRLVENLRGFELKFDVVQNHEVVKYKWFFVQSDMLKEYRDPEKYLMYKGGWHRLHDIAYGCSMSRNELFKVIAENPHIEKKTEYVKQYRKYVTYYRYV